MRLAVGRSPIINISINVVTIVGGVIFAVSFTAGYLLRASRGTAILDKAKAEAEVLLSSGLAEAEVSRKEAFSSASEEIARRRADFESDDKEQRSLIQLNEKRLQKKFETLTQRQEHIADREAVIAKYEDELAEIRKSIDCLIVEMRGSLERNAGLTSGEARDILLDRTGQEIRQDSAIMIKRVEADVKDNSHKVASEVITTAIQRCSGGLLDEPETPPAIFPSEEVKLRLIGREAKNLKLLQTLTGVEWTVDPDRNSVTFTSPDCVKREIARASALKLMNEVRLHPRKIEDIVEKVRRETNALIIEDGNRAAVAAEVRGLHPEIIKLLGRLRYRTSYGQNVLTHSVEVARLSGAMAAEIGGNTVLSRRAGLLHDIGKALDHELEGSHVAIGVELATKFGEIPDVIHCIGAHHGDEEFRTIEASLVSSADTLSAGRPGARRETLESYIRRVEALESMASSFEGVDKAYAIHAGREVRVLVKPDRISDVDADQLSHLVAKKLENELEYPGQIRVVVVRETRVVDFAK